MFSGAAAVGEGTSITSNFRARFLGAMPDLGDEGGIAAFADAECQSEGGLAVEVRVGAVFPSGSVEDADAEGLGLGVVDGLEVRCQNEDRVAEVVGSHGVSPVVEGRPCPKGWLEAEGQAEEGEEYEVDEKDGDEDEVGDFDGHGVSPVWVSGAVVRGCWPML